MSLQRAEADPEKRPDDGLDLFVLSYIFKYWSSYFLEVELPCQRVWTFFFFFFFLKLLMHIAKPFSRMPAARACLREADRVPAGRAGNRNQEGWLL